MKGSLTRARWAAIGAAVAVSLGGGVVMVAHAIVSPYSPAEIYVPVEPCRFNDTRGRSAAEVTAGIVYQEENKLGQNSTDTLVFDSLDGDRGYCDGILPTDGSMIAVVLNVTVTQGTAVSYLTIYPSDQTFPLVSSINWVNNGVDVANSVIMPLSSLEGAIKFYNHLGSVHYVVDVVGYYTQAPYA